MICLISLALPLDAAALVAGLEVDVVLFELEPQAASSAPAPLNPSRLTDTRLSIVPRVPSGSSESRSAFSRTWTSSPLCHTRWCSDMVSPSSVLDLPETRRSSSPAGAPPIPTSTEQAREWITSPVMIRSCGQGVYRAGSPRRPRQIVQRNLARAQTRPSTHAAPLAGGRGPDGAGPGRGRPRVRGRVRPSRRGRVLAGFPDVRVARARRGCGAGRVPVAVALGRQL